MRKSLCCVAALAALAVTLVLPAAASADQPRANASRAATDTYLVGAAVRDGYLPVASTSAPKGSGASGISAFQAQLAAVDPPIGTQKTFLIFDDFFGIYRLATFTMRGVGTHAVAWVQNNTNFPAGDCRNNFADRIQVTDPQVNYLLNQFDTNIWPKEADAFSIAPPHDG
jgi:hypothetical protein